MKYPLLLAAAALLVSACGSTQAVERDEISARYTPGIWNGETLEKVTPADFEAALASADYILVGETHDSPEDHAFQLGILESQLAKGRAIALGMEMFQRPYQPALDAYVAGESDEAAMLEATEWETRWGFEKAMYAPLWRTAKTHGRPIIALNARRELTKRVSKVGLSGLSEEEASALPEIDETDSGYHDWLGSVFAAHGMDASSPTVMNFIQAQLVWDETMADSAFRARQREDVDVVVVIVGRGHVENGWGIPSRLLRRDPDARVVSVVRAADGKVEGIDGRPLTSFVVVP